MDVSPSALKHLIIKDERFFFFSFFFLQVGRQGKMKLEEKTEVGVGGDGRP